MAITLEQVRELAALARLGLSEAELRLHQEQLSAILDAFAKIAAGDTARGQPAPGAAQAGSAPLREDRAKPSLGAGVAVANAPRKAGTRFAVPKIIG